jgi:hypothetical protein
VTDKRLLFDCLIEQRETMSLPTKVLSHIASDYDIDVGREAYLLSPFAPPPLVVDNTPHSGVLNYPYGDGPWLERLAFRLGTRQGYRMRYFGRNGMAQYGADLVGSKPDGTWAVWQCKNIGSPPSVGDLEAWVQKFCTEWLQQRELPKPDQFFICCPQLFRSKNLEEAWLPLVEKFRVLGIALDFWHRDSLDEELKEAPDLVADLFGDAQAHAFCGADRWRPSPLLHPVPFNATDTRAAFPPRLTRYALAAQTSAGVYSDEARQSSLIEYCRAHSLLLIRGEPGCGKTFEVLNLCSNWAQEGWRCYYLNLSDLAGNGSDRELANSIAMRYSVPSVFVLDDCHGHEDRIQAILHFLPANRRHHPHVRIICVQRRALVDVQERDEELPQAQAWIEDLQQQKAVIEWRVDTAYVQRYVRLRYPDASEIAPEQLNQLCSLTGKNLLLLSTYLQNSGGLGELDLPDARAKFFAAFRGRLPANLSVSTRQALWKLAALGQFEINPPDTWLPELPPALPAELDGYLLRAGWPSRWHFAHSSAAELFFHALYAGSNLEVDLANVLSGYFLSSIVEAQNLPAPLGQCMQTMRQAITVRPVLLIKDDRVRDIKKWLTEPELQRQWLTACAQLPDPGFAVLALHILDPVTDAGKTVVHFLHHWINGLLISCVDEASLPVFFTVCSALASRVPETWQQLLKEHRIERWLDLIVRNGTVYELFKLLEKCPAKFANALIDELDAPRLQVLLSKTRSAQRSIGTVALLMRELEKKLPDLLDRLLDKTSAEDWLDLIANSGTVLDLFKLLGISPAEFAKALVVALDAPRLRALLDKTRAGQRSIGTIGIAMRELEQQSPGLLLVLLDKTSAEDWLDLIACNGTVFELFKFLENCPAKFANALVDALDTARLQVLLNRTLTTKRAMGTINLSMRKLEQQSPGLLQRLLDKTSAEDWLNLMASNGTVFELFKFLEKSAADFANTLIDALDAPRLQRLFKKTCDEKRSIGTLNLTLYKLRSHGKALGRGDALLERLQALGQAEGFAKLMLECGDFGAWVDLLAAFSPDFGRNVTLALLCLGDDASWQTVARRKGFYELVQIFVCPEMEAVLADDNSIALQRLRALALIAPSMAMEAKWYSLATADNLLRPASEIVRAHLNPILRDRCSQIREVDLPSSGDWKEFANAAQLLLVHRIDLWPIVASRVMEAFVDIAHCKDMPIQIASMLFLLRQDCFSDAQVRACLQAAQSAEVVQRMIVEDPVKRLLWLWNIVAVHWERFSPTLAAAQAGTILGQGMREHWGQSLTKDLCEAWRRDALQAKTAAHVQKALTLAGLLNWLGYSLPEIRWSSAWLRSVGFKSSVAAIQSDSLGFVPAYFLQWGALALLHDQYAFQASAKVLLCKKLQHYGQLTWPIKALAQHIPTSRYGQ